MVGFLIYFVLGRVIARFCFHVFGRLEIRGQEHIPLHGPVILISNHVSNKDPAYIVASMHRRVYFIAKDELFRAPILGWVLRKVGMIPLIRSSKFSTDVIRKATQRLENEDVMGIFPEQHRSNGLGIREFSAGPAYLAARCSGVCIVPVGLEGTDRFSDWQLPFPLSRKFPFRHRVRITFGPSFELPGLEDGKKPTKEMLDLWTALMEDRVKELLPEEYTKPYSGEDYLVKAGSS